MSQPRAVRRPLPRVLLILSVIFLLMRAAAAQQNTPAISPADTGGAKPPAAGATQNPQAESTCPTPADLATVKVSAVSSVHPIKEESQACATEKSEAQKPKGAQSQGEASDQKPPVVELRDTIAVKIANLKILQDHERCLEIKDGRARDIILYLDSRPLPKVVAKPPSDPKDDVLKFPLSRTEDSREVWTYLLGRPNPTRIRQVEVSVGIDDQFAVPSNASVCLRVIPLGWFSFWVLIFATLVIGFFLLARRSDVLRDPVSAPPGARPPYSLARTQAAWWFFLILAAYLLIGMVTGDFSSSITGTTLALLGISAGTAVGSAFVDAGKTSMTNDAQDAARATALQAEIKALDQEIADLDVAVRTNGDPQQAYELEVKQALRTEKASLYRKATHQSERFLLDILSDTGGVNFHRFQMLAWTVVLGFIFVGHVYRDLAMPQFNETLLALLGISAGTFLGLKIPESPSQPPTPPNPAIPNTAPPNPAPPNPAPPNPAAPNPAE